MFSNQNECFQIKINLSFLKENETVDKLHKIVVFHNVLN